MTNSFKLSLLTIGILLVPATAQAMVSGIARRLGMTAIPAAAMAVAFAQKAQAQESFSDDDQFSGITREGRYELSVEEQKQIAANVKRVAETGECNNCDLRYARMYDAIESAQLKGEKVSLKNARLSYANMSYIDFVGANFNNADLRNADLTGVNFIFTNLRGANLQDANMAEVKFYATDLRGAYYTAKYINNCYRCQTKISKWFGLSWDEDNQHCEILKSLFETNG